MGFLNFSSINRWLIKETSDLLQLGSFTLTTATEMTRIQVTLLKVGAHASTAKFRLKIYPNSDYVTAIYTSEYVNIADLDGVTASNWVGWVSPTFSRSHLAASRAFYLGVESANYTRNGSTHYLGFKTNWPDPASSGAFVGPQISIVGYR